MDIVSSVVASIREANLAAELYRTARELLDLAGDNGQVKISKQAMMTICRTASEGTMRRQLGILKRAGIIHVSTNNDVHVSFVGFPTVDEMITGRAPVITPCAESVPQEPEDGTNETDEMITARAPTRAGRAPVITPCALPHTRGVSLFVSDPIPSSEEELTNQLAPPGPPGPKRHVWEAPLSFRLLTDKRVAMSPRIAERLASAHAFWEIRDAVAHWYSGRQSVGGRFDDTCGIVITWLDRPEDFVIPAMSDEYRRSDLYRDFRTPDELAAEHVALDEAQRPAVEDAVTPQAGEPELRYEPDEGTPEWAWEQVKRELAVDQGGAFDRWVYDAGVLRHEDETNRFVIGLPDASRYDWIVSRLSMQIRRKLSVITGRPADVVFIVTETGTVSRETQGDQT